MPQPIRNQTNPMMTFDDFSAGIVQRTGVAGALANSPSKLGAASITNTYRCVALPGGGLGPLPRKTITKLITDLGATNIPGAGPAIIQSIKLVGGMYKKAGGANPAFPVLPASPYELHIMFEYASAGTQTQRWRKYPYYSGDTAVEVFSAAQPTTNRYGPAYLTLMRMFPANPLVIGYPVVVGSWSTPNDPIVANTDYAQVYPDPTSGVTILTDATFDLTFPFFGPGLVHQNRYVAMQRAVDPHGNFGGVLSSDERLRFTVANDYTDAAAAVPTVFGQEIPTGYGAWGSLSSSDLLLIKHGGGAYLVQGDMLNPIVRRFPGVTGTGGIEVVGGSTPAGFVYASRDDGVFAWNGGDGSIELSPQLEDGFWQISTATPYNFGGQFLSWGSWVVTPNNFLYDPATHSWWRLDDTTVGVWYLYDKEPISNILFASPSVVVPGGVMAVGYSQQLGATNFSWQSQPFSLAARRRAQLREVYLLAQGTGTVTVSFSTDGSVLSQPAAFTINSSTPTLQRVNMSAIGTEFVMRIVSDGGAGTAPIIYAVQIAFEEAENVASN